MSDQPDTFRLGKFDAAVLASTASVYAEAKEAQVLAWRPIYTWERADNATIKTWNCAMFEGSPYVETATCYQETADISALRREHIDLFPGIMNRGDDTMLAVVQFVTVEHGDEDREPTGSAFYATFVNGRMTSIHHGCFQTPGESSLIWTMGVYRVPGEMVGTHELAAAP